MYISCKVFSETKSLIILKDGQCHYSPAPSAIMATTVLCPKRLECALFLSFVIFSVILHAMHTPNIPIYADYFDHNDKTSGDSLVTTMAITIR